jgi:hypothetical protein
MALNDKNDTIEDLAGSFAAHPSERIHPPRPEILEI